MLPGNNNRNPKNEHSECRRLGKILSVIGDKWTIMIMGALSDGPLRYNELRRKIGGVSQRMLTLTLRRLERDGLLTRTVYPTIPPRVDYDLTSVGRSLIEPLQNLSGWATAHLSIIEEAQKAYDDHLSFVEKK